MTAVALVAGNMIGSGVFLLPASLAPFGGLSFVGWAISSLGSIALALVFARYARISPDAGGPYAYARRSFGDLPAFLVAWSYWMSVWATNAALAVAFVGYLDPFAPTVVRDPLKAAVLAVAIVWLLVFINSRGVRQSGQVQVLTTAIKVVPLLAIGIVGLAQVEPSHFDVPATATSPVAAVMATVTLTLWAFLGLESATIPADHVRDAARTIPRATIIGTVTAAAIYIVSTTGVRGVLPPAMLSQSTAPFADAAGLLFGSGAAGLVAIGAAISCFGTLNGWTLMVGQLPRAVARDGLFPAVFARVSSRGTPVAGMVIGGALSTALIAANYADDLVALFTFIILLSTLGTLVPYVICSLAAVLRRPGTVSAQVPSTPVATTVAIAALAYAILAVIGAGGQVLALGTLAFVAGLPVFYWSRRQRLAPSMHA
ncbi:MAG TPA: amino acid permease [Vicinamibacterales bacterium]|nr:amino acid permease [Vicinamibacterales bacterium]